MPFVLVTHSMRGILKIGSFVLVCVSIVMGMSACADEEDFSTDLNHRLSFSTDTVAFDTLFTEVSSATQTFLIYNRNRSALRISHAFLSGGDNSPYRVNVDGLVGPAFSDVTIRGGDSMYVFVEVTVDPRGQDAPFEVRDSLCFVLESGVCQQVIFTAGGQDATVLRGAVIDTDTRLVSSRPYLIYDSLRVEEGSTLYMDPGVRLYFSDKAELQVYGRIEAVGTVESPIVFRGARTDHMFDYLPYDRLSAQWGGITLHETSADNRFEHCDIHSGTYGLRAKSKDTDSQKLVMHSSQIHNVDEDALQLTSCKALFANSLFTNAGGHCVNILGGQIDFVHCTIANFFPWKSERGAAVNMANYVEEEGTVYPLLGVHFINSIVTGSKNDELTGTIIERTDTADWTAYAQYAFTHSLINSWDAARDPDTLHFAHVKWEDKDSVTYGRSNFRLIDHSNFIYDFHLDSLSVARGIATDEHLDRFPCDKDEQLRSTPTIDAGCYQFIEHVEEEK